MRKLLAVRPDRTEYLNDYDVTVAWSYPEAKRLILEAEERGRPFDTLDLCVRDKRAFREFLDWMEKRRRRYPFSIFGYRSDSEFIRIRDKARKRGFIFNS